MGIPKIFKRNKPVDDDKVINKTKKIRIIIYRLDYRA